MYNNSQEQTTSNWYVVQSVNPLYGQQLVQSQGFDPSFPSVIWAVSPSMQSLFMNFSQSPLESRTTLTSLPQDAPFGLQRICPIDIEPIRSVASQTSIELVPTIPSARMFDPEEVEDFEGDASFVLTGVSSPKRKKPLGRPPKENSHSFRYYKQNPSRNIITNIGNQLLTFLCTPSKSEIKLRELRPDYEQHQIDEFFMFCRRVKKETDYYLNMQKMQALWYPQNLEDEFEDFQKILRTLSSYFLVELLPPCIITSTKMKKETKYHHIRVRKQLISLLRRRAAFVPRGLASLVQLYRTK